MKDLKFGLKLAIAFGIVILLIIFNTIWIIYNLNDLVNDNVTNVKGADLKLELHDAYIAHLEWANEVQDVFISDNIYQINVETNDNLCDFGQWYYGEQKTEIEELIPELKGLLNEIETPHENLHKSVIEINQILASEDSAKIEKIKILYNTTTKVYLKEVIKILDKISNEADSYIITAEHMKEQHEALKSTTLTLAIIVIILSILLAYFITMSIVKSLSQGIKFVNQIADGDLTAKIEIDQKDEVGQLVSAMKKMIENLSNTLLSIQISANQITLASTELSDNSQIISQGASEQASSTEEVSSSMEQMAANINQNTENAQQTEKISQVAAEQIKKGSEVVNQTVVAMKKIADRIIIIREIAQQTDLLAINAAVEAARAGEHGKGFAVVANEVRKLAEKSQKAAKEIDELTKSSVNVADEAGKLLAEIVPQILKTAILVQEIVAASMEQNQGAAQVNNAIQQLNQITQQNAASAEEMATSAEELSSQAEQLLDSISEFKTQDKKISANNQSVIKKTNFRTVDVKRKNIEKKSNSNSTNNDKLDLGYEKF